MKSMFIRIVPTENDRFWVAVSSEALILTNCTDMRSDVGRAAALNPREVGDIVADWVERQWPDGDCGSPVRRPRNAGEDAMTDAIAKAREAAVREVERTTFGVGVAFHADLGIAAFLAALKTQGLVIEPGWREIESAPKDGTCILVGVAGDADSTRLVWWQDWGKWFDGVSSLDDPPTHWRPLPAPPAMLSAAAHAPAKEE